MKIVPVLASALAAVCVASSAGLGASAQEVTAARYGDAGFTPVVGQELKLTPALRRHLQTSGSSTMDSPATTAPAPTTATPTTTSPATTTATPTTTTPATTTATPTPTTATPTPTTATPSSTTATPSSTTATPSSTTATPSATTATPDATTATPSSTTATPSATSTASSTSTDTTTPTSSTSSTSGTAQSPSATESATTSTSGSGSSASSSDTSSGSSMSTGAVIGIVVGIVAAVAIIASVIMCVIRRRRETEDDPLSPFELSMDKGYNPTPGGFNVQNSYNPRAMGAAAASASASGSVSNTHTPPADAVAAGVAYSQFYDGAATSPGSMNRLESNVDSVQTDPGNANATTNGTNLWLSAMEPKDNDSYLSAHESPRSSANSSRNSYDMSTGQAIDVDQSSQISGKSNNDSDFPDHHEDNDSARGSYEL